MIDIMLLVALGFVLGAACFTAYDFLWQRKGKAGFSWVGLLSLFLSLLIDVLAAPLLRVPGSCFGAVWVRFGVCPAKQLCVWSYG